LQIRLRLLSIPSRTCCCHDEWTGIKWLLSGWDYSPAAGSRLCRQPSRLDCVIAERVDVTVVGPHGGGLTFGSMGRFKRHTSSSPDGHCSLLVCFTSKKGLSSSCLRLPFWRLAGGLSDRATNRLTNSESERLRGASLATFWRRMTVRPERASRAARDISRFQV
jgi:hypothetical protein